MERQRQELGVRNTNGRLAFDKLNNTKKGKSLIRKTENLLDIILYDNMDFPRLCSKGFH